MPNLRPMAVQTPKAFHSIKLLNRFMFAKLDFSNKSSNNLLSTWLFFVLSQPIHISGFRLQIQTYEQVFSFYNRKSKILNPSSWYLISSLLRKFILNFPQKLR